MHDEIAEDTGIVNNGETKERIKTKHPSTASDCRRLLTILTIHLFDLESLRFINYFVYVLMIDFV